MSYIPFRNLSLATTLIGLAIINTGCSVKLHHDTLKSAATRASGTLNVSSLSEGMPDRIGFCTFTIFAIPIAPIMVEGDPNSQVMLQVKDAVEAAGYNVKFVEPSYGVGPVASKVLKCRVTEIGFRNYTYFFPLVPTWGGIKTEVQLVSGGCILWRKDFHGGAFTMNFFNGFNSCVGSSVTKNLKAMVQSFDTPEFRAALASGPTRK